MNNISKMTLILDRIHELKKLIRDTQQPLMGDKDNAPKLEGYGKFYHLEAMHVALEQVIDTMLSPGESTPLQPRENPPLSGKSKA